MESYGTTRPLTLRFPTLCEPGTTAAKFSADMLEEADEMVEMLP